MRGHPHVRGIPSNLRSEAAILAAVARESLLECHARHAVELVELARGRVEPERMLEIYARLHHLDTESTADVRGRALAALGERAIRYAVLSPIDEVAESAPPPPPPTLWARIRARFSRRMHHGLRRDVDRHTGRTEVDLMEVHAEHALRYVRALESHFTVSHAVRLYAEALGLRESLRETLYLLVLSRLGDATPEKPLAALPGEGPAGVATAR